MRNTKTLIKHCEKVYNQRIKDAKKKEFRLDSRGIRVPMTEKGLAIELKNLEKAKAKALKRIELAAQDSIKRMVIRVEWHKSKMWGYNPVADIDITTTNGKYYNTTGKASGCGYDKESAAIGSALYDIAVFDNLIFDNYKKYKKANSHPFYYRDTDALPFLEISGTGVGTLRNWAEMCGYKWHEEHGKSCDFYIMEK